MNFNKYTIVMKEYLIEGPYNPDIGAVRTVGTPRTRWLEESQCNSLLPPQVLLYCWYPTDQVALLQSFIVFTGMAKQLVLGTLRNRWLEIVSVIIYRFLMYG